MIRNEALLKRVFGKKYSCICFCMTVEESINILFSEGRIGQTERDIDVLVVFSILCLSVCRERYRGTWVLYALTILALSGMSLRCDTREPYLLEANGDCLQEGRLWTISYILYENSCSPQVCEIRFEVDGTTANPWILSQPRVYPTCPFKSWVQTFMMTYESFPKPYCPPKISKVQHLF